MTPFQAHSFDALPCSSIGSVQFCSVSNVLVRYQVKTSFGISQHLTAQHCLQCCSDIIANCSSENKLLHFKRTQGCRSFKKGNSWLQQPPLFDHSRRRAVNGLLGEMGGEGEREGVVANWKGKVPCGDPANRQQGMLAILRELSLYSGLLSLNSEWIVFWWPNTNTNIILLLKNDWIRILFGLKKSTEHEYEYHSVWKNHPNTNTNTSIRSQLFE